MQILCSTVIHKTKCHPLSYWIRRWYFVIRSLYLSIRYSIYIKFEINLHQTSRTLNEVNLLKKYDRKDITLSLCYKIPKKCTAQTWCVFRSSTILFIKISHWKMYVRNIQHFSLNCNKRYRNQVNYSELRKHLSFKKLF